MTAQQLIDKWKDRTPHKSNSYHDAVVLARMLDIAMAGLLGQCVYKSSPERVPCGKCYSCKVLAEIEKVANG